MCGFTAAVADLEKRVCGDTSVCLEIKAWRQKTLKYLHTYVTF